MENKKEKTTNQSGPLSFSNDKPKNAKKTIKTLFKHLKEYRLSIILVVLLAIGSALFSIVGPKVLGDAVSELFSGFINKIIVVNGFIY